MNTQTNTEPKAKDPAKDKEDMDEQETAAEGEIKMPPPGAAHSLEKIPIIIQQNLFLLLNNTGNEASTTAQPASPVQESPAKVDHHKSVKPQAATDHQLNADEQPGNIVKPLAETIPDAQKAPSAHQGGTSPKKKLRNTDPAYIGKKGNLPPRNVELCGTVARQEYSRDILQATDVQAKQTVQQSPFSLPPEPSKLT